MQVTTHENLLATQGYDICSPISGSMKPLIRPRRDCAIFVRSKERLKKYDVALYRRGSSNVMHRVLTVKQDHYVIRGDYCFTKEIVYDDQIIGVMRGFYRDDRYYEVQDWRYRIYSVIWPKCNTLIKWINPFRIHMCEFLHRIKFKCGLILTRNSRVDIIDERRK